MAVASPLLETSFRGATGVIFNIRGSQDELTMHEVNEALKVVHDEASADANIIFGAVFDEKLAGQVHVTVIATGFEGFSRPPSQAAVATEIEVPAKTILRHPAAPTVAHNDGPSSADIPEFLRNIIRPR